jgi:outer membrane protein assembly factor BamB
LKTAAKRHAATPVILGDRVLVNSHTIGLLCFEIRKTGSGSGMEAVPAWENKTLKINLATPVHVDGFLYSQGANKDFICVDARTGELKWSQPGFGLGKKDYASTIAIGKTLLVLTEDGQLLMVAADPAKYQELGRVQVCGSTWSYPALAAGRLYVRDGRQLFCVDLNRAEAAGL